MPEARVNVSPLQSPEQMRWVQGDAHGLAVTAVMETRREIEENSRGLDRMVEERAFKPYAYHSISGAGTALESALRQADSRLLVSRPRSSDALHNSCLSSFEGFGAGSGDVSGLGRVPSSVVDSAPGGSGLGSSSLGGSGLSRVDGPGRCRIEGRDRESLSPGSSSPDVPTRSSSGLFDVSTRTLLSGASSLAPKH